LTWGLIIVGAHKTATIANAIQRELSTVLQEAMEGHEFTAQGIEHVWYIECSSAGVQEVAATKLKGYEFMLLPDELTAPADKLNRLQKEAMRFVEEAEEQMEVKEWNNGVPNGELAQMARKAYKTAQPAINAALDTRLLESFCIGDAWELATPEQTQERKDEWNDAKKRSIKSSTHGVKRRQRLARAIMLSPDEAGA
jgi:hypothetical protein